MISEERKGLTNAPYTTNTKNIDFQHNNTVELL